MTEKKDTVQSFATQRTRMTSERDARIADALAQLGKLSSFDLADVLFKELDRRRLDANGNPTDPDGLYLAVITGITVILGDSCSPEEAVMAQNVAAVGRGARIGAETNAATMREFATLLEAMDNTDRFSAAEKSTMLARTLSKRFGRAIDTSEVDPILAESKIEKRVTALCFCARIVGGVPTEEDDWRRAYDSVRKALKWRGALDSTD